ncbi:MAG: tRNA pseudouridine(55) synthase TruB [Blastocatellia bacterium]|nr:tRNA pseudouridine(55) synthase TruB [Blastocatellia bacterium]
MNGVLVIDKPAGITSHDVVSKVRRALGTRRVGHTGTLDPFATGVMVVLVGNVTRLAQFLDRDEKEYVAEVRFGYETDTGDRTGVPKSDDQSSKGVSSEMIKEILPGFIGEIEQTPPMYSAKKIEGRKLYELAREGKEIERKSVSLTIRELELLGVREANATIRVVSSAGTYIRTLAEDIARAMGTHAHLSELRRTRSGKFDLSRSVRLDDLDKDTELIDANDALADLREFVVPEERNEKTRNGLSTRIDENDFSDGETVRMTTADGELLAIGCYNGPDGSVQPKVVLS